MNPVFAALEDLSTPEMFFRVSGPEGIFSLLSYLQFNSQLIEG